MSMSCTPSLMHGTAVQYTVCSLDMAYLQTKISLLTPQACFYIHLNLKGIGTLEIYLTCDLLFYFLSFIDLSVYSCVRLNAVVHSCEHGNGLLKFHKGREFFVE
jgi:hypothetical protein